MSIAHHDMTHSAIARVACMAVICGALACAREAPREPSRSRAVTAAWGVATLDTLLRLAREDNASRNAPTQLHTATDTVAIFAALRADSMRTRWAQQAIARHGWPVGTVRGDSALEAAWTILQHSPDTAWQGASLRELALLAKRGELPKPNLALLTDRVLNQRGEPQLYGSQFDLVDGRAVPAPILDLTGLDARRASMGLGPMKEYVRKLEEVYQVPVVWPPPR